MVFCQNWTRNRPKLKAGRKNATINCVKNPLRTIIIILVLLLLIIALWYYFFRPSSVNQSASNGETSGFSPLDQESVTGGQASSTYFNNEFIIPSAASATPPVAQPQNPAEETPSQPTESAPPAEPPAQGGFFTSFIEPEAQGAPADENLGGTVENQPAENTAPSNPYPIYYNYTAPTFTATNPATSTQSKGGGSNTGGTSLDETIFGYVSGLGWTQLLGSTGKEIFNIIYGTTPGELTNETLGSIVSLPGAGSVFGTGGSGGGGGIGGGAGGLGGGGGATGNFGTLTISQITECTCSGSRMLTLTDVRGTQLKLVVTPGTQVKATAMSMYGITQGMKALGTYVPGGACLIVHGDECDSSQGTPQGTVSIMGTSAD